MTFKEFQIKLVRDPMLGKLLPMNCKKTFPRFELVDQKLYVSFLGVQTKPVSEGMEVKEPTYYLRVLYPQCQIRSFVRFDGEKASHLMSPLTSETMKELVTVCDEVLRQYDEKVPALAETVAQYNTLLDQVLEAEQLAVLNKMATL